MTIFADASALVKRYADEAGSEDVRAARPLVVSELSRVEVASALWRKQRMGELGLHITQLLLAAAEWDWWSGQELVAVPITTAIVEDAVDLLGAFDLRAADALQLSTAVTVAAELPDGVTFACYDERLRTAAEATGLSLL